MTLRILLIAAYVMLALALITGALTLGLAIPGIAALVMVDLVLIARRKARA